MSLKKFKYCPNCREVLAINGNKASCAACRFAHYENPAPGAGVVPIQDGKALIGVRGIEPYKGSYDVIGGFLHAGESPRQTAVRECKEETGLDVEITGLIGIYPDQYGADGVPTLVFNYAGRVIGGRMQANDDVSRLEWVPIQNLPLNQGFQNARATFRDLQSRFPTNTPGV